MDNFDKAVQNNSSGQGLQNDINTLAPTTEGNATTYHGTQGVDTGTGAQFIPNQVTPQKMSGWEVTAIVLGSVIVLALIVFIMHRVLRRVVTARASVRV
jgi:hypothetical protein